MTPSSFITRFAPSPSGYLHLGHAYSALTVWRAACDATGRFILRIEDIDTSRCRPEFEAALYTDLAFLGINWPVPVRRQSEHFDDYEQVLRGLIDKGLVYRCFRTRREITDEIARAPHLVPHGPDGPVFTGKPLPAGEERARLANGAPFAWRLSIDAALDYLGDGARDLVIEEQQASGLTVIPVNPRLFGDVVLGRKDSGTSYHLASVHDDAAQGVTHVIRGEDLRAAAHLHVLLQALLELPSPVYRYHRLITDETGRRLAKRDRDETLIDMRARGLTRDDILATLGFRRSDFVGH